MKQFKKIIYALLLTIFTFGFSADSFAFEKNPFSRDTKDRKQKKEKRERRERKSPVGAPIDGGILTILGAAGVSYYLMRKKNKK